MKAAVVVALVAAAAVAPACALFGIDPALCENDGFCPWGERCVSGACTSKSAGNTNAGSACDKLVAAYAPGVTAGPVLTSPSFQTSTGAPCTDGTNNIEVIVNVDATDAEGDFFTSQGFLDDASPQITVRTTDTQAASDVVGTSPVTTSLDGNSGQGGAVGLTVCRRAIPVAVAVQMPDHSGHLSAAVCTDPSQSP